ncbi:MAG TPA: nucleotidyltransferase family protein [Deltaproteobacteria bacterium]|nr:nucleotidyltransferase family protein [Deltaproteobacteria bacterium]
MAGKTRLKACVSGIVLAAGRSSRIGGTKQLLEFNGNTLLGGVIAAAKSSRLDEILVVLGHDAQNIERRVDLSGVRVVMNEDYEQGQSTSVKAGLGHVSPHADAAMFLLADQPLVDGRIIDALIAGFEDSRKPIVVPVSGGRRGNPVIIGRELFAELAASARGDAGARVLFGAHAGDIRCVDLGTLCIHADVDTLEDYRRLLATAGYAPEDPSQARSNDEVKDEHTGEA